MNRLPSFLAAIATFCGAASMAQAQGPGGGRSQDADGDGKVSASEHAASGVQRFARMDENGDGVIGKAEAKAIRKRAADRMMNAGVPPSIMAARADPIAEMDADKDGQVSREEAAALQQARFAAADQNGDGALDAAEQAVSRSGAPPRG